MPLLSHGCKNIARLVFLPWATMSSAPPGHDGLAAISFTGYKIFFHPHVQRTAGPFPPCCKSNTGQLSTQILISQSHSQLCVTLRRTQQEPEKLSSDLMSGFLIHNMRYQRYPSYSSGFRK